jgi:hypothetical protein
MSNREANSLIERADLAFERVGRLAPDCFQRMQIELARLVRDQMTPQLLGFLNLAEEHVRSGGRIAELRAAKDILFSQKLERTKAADRTVGSDFLRDLVDATLSTDTALEYSAEAPILSHIIWWMTSLGAPLDAIEATLTRYLPIQK